MAASPSRSRNAQRDSQPAFADLLRHYREVAGLTQETLAERAQLSWRTISDLERGAKHTPRQDTLDLLIAALGLSPDQSVQFRAVGRRLDVPTAAGEGVPLPAPRNPYKGLRAFRDEDARDFFGREDLIAALVAALNAAESGAHRFLAVLGPSGSGKSSVVMAGLLPRLRAGALAGSDRWIYPHPVVPGAHPLESLTVSLSRALPGSSLTAIRADLNSSPRGLHLLGHRLAVEPETRVLLVIDQGEELFTLAGDEAERQQFIDLLVTAVSEPGGPIQAIMTLRADFYDRPMSYPALGRLLEANNRSVLPMSIAELRAAIEGPAALPDTRLTFETGVIDDLLFDVRGQAGALPLLEFTLDQLYQRRQGRCLTNDAYADLGGVRGALARHAEATYLALPSEGHRQLARALFLRLIDPGATEHDTTRRRAPVGELVLSDPHRTASMREVTDAFIAARLLIGGEWIGMVTVEVCHEALIREWVRLGEWLRTARDEVRLQRRLSDDTAEWLRRDQPADLLYHGSVLEDALAWAARNTPSIEELTFLTVAKAERAHLATIAQEEQAQHLALAQQAAQASRQAARRLRYFVAVLVLSLVVAAGLSGLALTNAATATTNAHHAMQARATAVADRLISQSRQLAAQALTQLDSHYDLALLLSVEAGRVADTPEARDSLLRGLEYNPRLITFLHSGTGAVASVAFSPDGSTLASGDQSGIVRLWQVTQPDRSWKSANSFAISHGRGVYGTTFSARGDTLAASNFDGTVRLWRRADRERARAKPGTAWLPLASLVERDRRLYSVAFSPRGALLATGSDRDTVQFWRGTRSGTRWIHVGPPLTTGADGVPSMAFSPDGTIVAAGNADGTIQLWDVASRRPIGAPLTGHMESVTSMAFSPDGRLLASASDDGTVRLWRSARRRVSWAPLGAPLLGHGESVTSVAFNPHGDILVSGGTDGSVRLWDVAERRLLAAPLIGYAGSVYSLSFNPQGTILAAGTQNGATLLWDLTQHASNQTALSTLLSEHLGDVTSLAFSPSGAILAYGTDAGRIRLRDMARHQELGSTLDNLASTMTSLTFSPHGSLLVSGSDDGIIRLWSVGRTAGTHAAHGRLLAGHMSSVRAIAFSSDGRTAATASEEGTIRLWDVPRWRLIGRTVHAPVGDVTSMAFSPDQKILAYGTQDGTIRLWDVARRQSIGSPLTGHAYGVTSLAFSPDGATLASGGIDRTIRLWDVAHHQPLGAPFTGHTGSVDSLAFSHDGTMLASGSYDQTIRLWDVDQTAWLRRACRIANRNFTWQEWQQYLGNLPYRSTCS